MTVRILREPATEAAVNFLRSELLKGFVAVVGECRIEYAGRAISTLKTGERIALFKPDGTLLVHTARGLKPVNWQPPGGSFQAALEDGELVITSTRERPKEIVRLVYAKIDLLTSAHLHDRSDLQLEGTEDDLQALIAARPELVEHGLRMVRREKRSARGPMDIYAEDSKGRRVVVEVKRGVAGLKEVEQLRRYVERERAARSVEVRGIMVAAAVSARARRFLEDLRLEWREIDWKSLARRRSPARPAGQASLLAYSRGRANPPSGAAGRGRPEKK